MSTPALSRYIQRGLTVRPGALDLAELHKEFVTEQRFSTRLSPVTLRGYRDSFSLLMSLMPELTGPQLTAATMTEFFRHLDTRRRALGRGKVRIGVKASTVATYRSKLNRFFAWLKANGHIPANPFDGMSYPQVAYEETLVTRERHFLANLSDKSTF
jgi:site-specific recombinase XerC